MGGLHIFKLTFYAPFYSPLKCSSTLRRLCKSGECRDFKHYREMSLWNASSSLQQGARMGMVQQEGGERGRKQELLLYLWVPTAVFRSLSLDTQRMLFLPPRTSFSYRQSAFNASRREGFLRVALSELSALIGEGRREARCASERYSVSAMSFQLHFQLSHSPPSTAIYATIKLETVVSSDLVRTLKAGYIFLHAFVSRAF